VIELALKFDAICIYICTHSRNYHIRLLWSPNRYHNWIHTEIGCNLNTHMYSFRRLPYLVSSITKWILWLNLYWNLMQFPYTYVLMPQITVLGYSNPKMGITIECSTPNELTGHPWELCTIHQTSAEQTVLGFCHLYFHGLSLVYLTERCGSWQIHDHISLDAG
jgi:hypothetical protein